MSKQDFNFFRYGDWASFSTNVNFVWDTQVANGGSSRSLALWNSSINDTEGQWGLIYNKRDYLNCITSVAVRTSTGYGDDFDSVGVIARAPFLFPTATLLGDTNRNFYHLGLYQRNTQSGALHEVRLFRTLHGVRTQLSIGTYNVEVIDNSFVQFALKAENNLSDDVELSLSYNTGTALSHPTPGGGDWTAWDLLDTDTGHGGVLNKKGYCGFGSGHMSTTGSSGHTSSAKIWFDQWRVEDL